MVSLEFTKRPTLTRGSARRHGPEGTGPALLQTVIAISINIKTISLPYAPIVREAVFGLEEETLFGYF